MYVDPDAPGARTFPGFSDGVLFEGSKASLVANYGKLKLLPDEFARDFKAPSPTLSKSVGHHAEWLGAIRGVGKPLCHFGYSGVLTDFANVGDGALKSLANSSGNSFSLP